MLVPHGPNGTHRQLDIILDASVWAQIVRLCFKRKHTYYFHALIINILLFILVWHTNKIRHIELLSYAVWKEFLYFLFTFESFSHTQMPLTKCDKSISTEFVDTLLLCIVYADGTRLNKIFIQKRAAFARRLHTKKLSVLCEATRQLNWDEFMKSLLLRAFYVNDALFIIHLFTFNKTPYKSFIKILL